MLIPTPIKIFHHQSIHRLDAAFVVASHRHSEHNKREHGRRQQRKHGSIANEERTDIERAAGAVGGDELEVAYYSAADGLDE